VKKDTISDFGVQYEWRPCNSVDERPTSIENRQIAVRQTMTGDKLKLSDITAAPLYSIG